MLSRVLKVVKYSVMMWVCILLPILIGFLSIKSASSGDIQKYVDSYVETESICLSKYVGLQLKNTWKELVSTADILATENQAKTPSEAAIASVLRDNSNIVSVAMYNKDGNAIMKQNENDPEVLDVALDHIKSLADQDMTFTFRQQDDGAVVLDFVLFRDKVGNHDPFYMTATVKWSQYENFLDRLQIGSFPRKFYIISPDCQRYISLNSLPAGAESNRNLVALGMHLAKQIQSIKVGISDIELEGNSYHTFKGEIKLPDRMEGSRLFIVSVTDEDSSKALTDGIFSRAPSVIIALLFIWLIVCLIVSKFFVAAKETLSVAEAITSSTPSATVVFELETGKIVKINPAGMTLLRLVPEKVPEVNAWNIFISEKDKNYVLNAINSNIHIINYEMLIQSFSSNTFWSVCSANPLEILDGMDSKMYIVLSVFDINKRKEMEKKLVNNAELLEKQVAERTADLKKQAKALENSNRQLDQAKMQADTANAAKTKFLKNMSAEFKTPINAIIGYSEILKEEALDRKDNVSADDLSKIIGSAKHLLSLVNEILDLSSIESGKTQLFFEHINLNKLIKEVEGLSMPLITKNENSFFTEYPKSSIDMYVDQTKLRQSLLNLIDNASKFTNFGKITLRVSSVTKGEVDYVDFAVIDTGSGIASEKLKNLFDILQGSTDKNSGTGLGLAIAKKYIECMGGSIRVESEVGVGSKFTIRLPKICNVESSDTIEIKNKKDEEIMDDFIAETEEEILESEEREETKASKFSRMSDQ